MRLELPSQRGLGGFTLIELMTVIVIIGIMTAVMIPEMRGSFQDALLRSSSRELINVFDLAYSRAVSLNQVRRVRLDEKNGHYLVEKKTEENGQENFVPVDDVPGNKGELDSRITVAFHKPDEAPAGESPASPSPVADEAPTSGVAINFYPDGTSDPGEIILRDRDGFQMTLRLNPITARVRLTEPEHK